MNAAANNRHLWGVSAFAFAFIRHSPTVFLVATPLLLFRALVGLVTPFASGAFLDALVAGTTIVGPFLLIVSLGATRILLEPAAERILSRFSRRMEFQLQQRLLVHVMRLGPSETSRIGNGELVGRILRDTGAAGTFIRTLYPRIILALVTLVGGSVAAFRRSWTLGVSFLAAVPLAALVFRPYMAKFRKSSHVLRRGSDSSIGRLFEFFHVLPFLQTLGAESRFAHDPLGSLGRLQSGNLLSDALNIGFGLACTSLSVLGECVVLGVAGILAATGHIPVGDVVAFQLLFLSAVGTVQGVVAVLPEAAAIRESVAALRSLLNTTPEKQIGKCEHLIGCENDKESFGEEVPFVDSGGSREEVSISQAPTIECRGVSFAYPGSESLVLRSLSLSIPAGAVVAITGANGAGKTTLLKLLCGALRPNEGDILVGGVPLSPDNLPQFRRRLGVVFQDNLLLSHSLLDNVTLRDFSIDATSINAALSASGADDVVRRLPAGLTTPLGNGGRSLSGGEIQKVAIARALVRTPSLLVFDEVTNHLDSSSRTAFCELLESLRGRCTVLLVTHDPDVLRRCNMEIPLKAPL